MKVYRSVKDWILMRDQLIKDSSTFELGFVPTMGALHEGHLKLVRRSLVENDATVVSVFVNRTQFNDPQDFEKYPRTEEEDLRLLERAGCDYALLPQYEEMYPDQYRYKVQEGELSQILCGAHRPGHFDGVLTVVMKLLNLTGATRAYFGEKDYQQYLLIRGMCEAFFIKTEIKGCPTVREEDGLAMSSRNRRLNPLERGRAQAFPKVLRSAANAAEAREQLQAEGFHVDYVEDLLGRRFGAVHLGQVRLIDNVEF